MRLGVFDMVGTTVHAGTEVPIAFAEALRSIGVELPESALSAVRGRSKLEAITSLVIEHAPAHDTEVTSRLVYDRISESYA